MTTNAQDEKWSEWIDWSGGECPLSDDAKVEYLMSDGDSDVLIGAGYLRWSHEGRVSDIIAYRYKIEEPESDMHPDLEWLARNVSEWAKPWPAYILTKGKPLFGFVRNNEVIYCQKGSTRYKSNMAFSQNEWKEARKKLGLDNGGWTSEAIAEAAFSHPEEEEAWQAKEKELNIPKYSAYFKDVRHIDTIDVYRVVDLFDCEKHGHPISHAAKKLLLSGSRTGGKDVEEDVREAIDALHRWLEMREEDKNAL